MSHTTRVAQENLREELLRNLSKLNRELAALASDARVLGAGAVESILRDASDDVFRASSLLSR